ncbi:MAG TPA: penicillin-binding protein 1A [Gammaproteobacteria bacterium]
MKNRKLLLKLTAIVLILSVVAAALGALTVFGAYLYLSPGLPPVSSLKDVRLQEPFRIYSRDGKLIGEFGEKRRIPLAIDEIPPRIQQAFLAAEDDRFYKHPGVDYQGLIRAVINQLMKGDRSQGGSTITMQLARNFFLSNEKTYIRKANEIFLALQIEKELSKDKILELYLNKIYLGKRAYGVAAAARIYYGKTVDELTLAETAMIAGLPKAPSTYNPIANPTRAVERRNYVLGRMLDLEMIDKAQYEEAVAAPVTAREHESMSEVEASYVAEMVRMFVVGQYGEEAYDSGLRVYTSLDSQLQAAANKALRSGLLDYERRHGYKGPVRRLELPDNTKAITLLVDQPPSDQETEADALQADRPAEEEAALEPGVHVLPQAEADSLLEEVGSFGNIRPGLVLGFQQQEAGTPANAETPSAGPVEYAELYLGHGRRGRLAFEGVQWARQYITPDQQGPEPESLQGVVKVGDIVWLSQTQEGGWQLAQLPEVEGALVSLDPQNGAIVSLVGGFDYFKSKFNRAIQAKRQAGSSFKPFIYTAALNNGFTAASIINDAPVVFDDPALEGKWRPGNYSGKFYGPTRLREGLVKSRNLVSIRLLIALGIGKAREYAKHFGFIDDSLPRDLSLALGSGTVTPLELASGFAVFANNGFRIQPFFIDRIEDAGGETIWMADYTLACLECFLETQDPLSLEENFKVEWPVERAESGLDEGNTGGDDINLAADTGVAETQAETAVFPADETLTSGEEAEPPRLKRVLRQAERVLDPKVSFIMNSILRDVVQRGTAVRARVLGRNDLAGKTGTTNDQFDAWFNGFNHQYVATVWVGYDSLQPLGAGETGSRAALPIWIDYMQTALEGVPEKPLMQPDGIVSIRIDSQTGLLATASSEDVLFEYFRTENVPTEEADTVTDGDIYLDSPQEAATPEVDTLF